MPQKRLSLQQIKELSKEEQEQVIKTIVQEAHDNEITHWGCSQAVLGALQRHLKLEDGGAFKAATALAGGVAGTREVCGALTGAVMAIGLAYGRAHYETEKVGVEKRKLFESIARAGKLCHRFREKFGSLKCSEVLVSIGRLVPKAGPIHYTPEYIKEHAKCGEVAGAAALLAAEIIFEPVELYTAGINAKADELIQVWKQIAAEESK